VGAQRGLKVGYIFKGWAVREMRRKRTGILVLPGVVAIRVAVVKVLRGNPISHATHPKYSNSQKLLQ
jgi:hypothetical protein